MSASSTTSRRYPGEVRDAIVTALRDAGKPMTVKEIRAAVAIQVGGKVPASSVRSYLNANYGPGKKFVRVRRGVYRLAR